MQRARAVRGVIWGVAMLAATSGRASAEESYEGRTISEWVADLGGGFSVRQKASKALIEIGGPAVEPILALVERRGPGTGHAFGTLAKMGEAARAALPVLMTIARDDSWRAPEGWTWSHSPRFIALTALREASWASKELIPFFLAIAQGPDESEDFRRAALAGLGGMGPTAAPSIRKLTRIRVDALREAAHHATIRALSLDPKEYFAEVLEDDPLDPNAPSYLGHTKGIYNGGRLDRLTERVKNALRERLAESPDPDQCWTLATIIQDQLSGTSIQFAAPSDSSSRRTDRENPKESFATLEKVLLTGMRCARKGSERWREFGIALAKANLLRGDWDGMNRWLAKLGWAPVPSARRAMLAAPPNDWDENLATTWGAADEDMRSGACGLAFRFAKDGEPLAGVHVLVKNAPAEDRGARLGIAADTLFLTPYPFARFRGSFGYRAADRGKTRYAVSDANGIVRIEKLPLVPVKLELLVPTGNFSEEGSAWELWMENDKGQFQRASAAPLPGAITQSSPEAQPKLVAGTIVEYPRVEVRSRFTLSAHDGSRADAGSFVLTWSPASPPPASYQLEMSLSAPQQDPGWLPKIPMLTTRTQVVFGTSWPVGARGVDGLTLEPGNVYVLRVSARDERGEVLSQSPVTRVWVPWKHRRTDPLSLDRDSRGEIPIYEGIWWRTSVSGVPLRPRIASYLKSHPLAFEREYVELGEAWIDWRDGETDRARKRLADLIEKLPARNVVSATAKWLAERMDSGAASPKRLSFQSFPLPNESGS